MRLTLSAALVALSAPALALSAVPASAAVGIDQGAAFVTLLNGDGAAPDVLSGDVWNHGRRHRGYDRGYDDGYRRSDHRRDYDDRDYQGAQTWRGNDGRTYCRRSDGTVGLVVGGAAGALIGRDIAGRRGDRTLGTVLGAAAGALPASRLWQGSAA